MDDQQKKVQSSGVRDQEVFRGDRVSRETPYFADPFVVPAFRAQWVEGMDT
jgi:hypothetical protein